MRKVLFLSPHLDDAVFSCATRILREVETGADVIVATIFSHARRRSPQWSDYVARREEDRRALHRLGARPRWLGLLDAPWRNPFYNSFRRIVLETAPKDKVYAAIVRLKLSHLINELKPDVLYIPLAVGTHIDHRLVFAAATSRPAKCARIFYEDQPYALVRSAVEMRLKNIGAAIVEKNLPHAIRLNLDAARETVRFIRSFRAAPYVRRYLPPGPQRKYVEAFLRRQLALPTKRTLHLKSETECSRPDDCARILRSLYAYHSQVRSFLGTRTQFIATSRRHAIALGLAGDRGERYWKQVEK